MSYDLKIVNGDLSLKNGDLDVVVNQDKLIQDIMKIALTTAGSNIYNPWYGSFLSQTIIGSPLDTSITVSMAQNQLQNAIDNLKKLQQLQVANTIQQVTPDEQIAGIKEIRVNRGITDPREFDITIKVLSRTFRQSTINFTM